MNKPFAFTTLNVTFVRSLLTALLWTLAAASVSAQVRSAYDGFTPSGLAPGTPAGTYALSGFDNINLYNGTLNVRLPLKQVGGRGTAGYTIVQPIEKHWVVKQRRYIVSCAPSQICTYDTTYWPDDTDWQGARPGYSVGVLQGRQTGKRYTTGCQWCRDGWDKTLTRLTFTAIDGTQYELRDQLNNGKPLDSTNQMCNIQQDGPARGRVWATADATAATFISDTIIYDDWGTCTTSSEGSNNEYIYPSGHLMLKDGTRYRIDNGRVAWMRDRNGNKLQFTSDQSGNLVVIDSINRQIAFGPSSYFTGSFSFPGSGGAATRTVSWGLDSQWLRIDYRPGGANYSGGGDLPGGNGYKSHAWLFPDLNGASSSSGPVPAGPSWVQLPDGRQYRFYYNPYGELARIELPTGGAIEYDWEGGPGTYGGYPEPVRQKPGVLFSFVGIYRRVVERRVYVDGTTLVEKTRYSESTDGNPITVSNQTPSGAVIATSKHYFHCSARQSIYPRVDPTDYEDIRCGREYKTEQYASDGTTLLRKTENTWQPRITHNWTWQLQNGTIDADLRLTEALNTLAENNQVAKTTFAYSLDEYNNQTDVWEYDYGPSAPGALLRHTQTGYFKSGYDTIAGGIDNPDPLMTVHIRNLPTSQAIYSDVATANKVAETSYEYDIYTKSLEGRSGITGLCDGTAQNCPNGPNFADPAYIKRGNVTKVSRWLNTTGSTVNTYQHYDVAGNVVEATDAKGNITTFDFTDCFGSPDNDARLDTPPTNPNWLNTQKTFAFVTKVTNALLQTTYTQYDYFLGQPVNAEDANGIVSSIEYNDALDRPTKGVQAIGKPVARQTRFIYNDASSTVGGNPPHSITTISDKDVFAQSNNGDGLKSLALYDGLGRTWRQASYEGSTWAIVQTQFDALGRVGQTSNPFRNADPATTTNPTEWTITSYDALSRVLEVKTPDNARVTTAYHGNRTLVSDQAKSANLSGTQGGQRLSEVNALGQLVNIWEVRSPDIASGTVAIAPFPNHAEVTAGYLTSYSYDTLGNLIQVAQGSQRRWFAYDSLSRLIRARNPEQRTYNFAPAVMVSAGSENNSAWSMAYTYDANGNLDERRSVSGSDGAPTATTTDYVYDALNRVTGKTYTGGTPAVNYRYDAQPLPGAPPNFNRGQATGRLVAVTYGGTSAGNYYGYDEQGRVKESFQQTAGQDYKFGYKYNLAGGQTEQSYPSGRVVTTGYDTAGRLNDVKLAGRNWSYASQFSYAAHGAVKEMKLGNGLWEQMMFNSRLQVTQIGLGTMSGDTSKLKLVYGYNEVGLANNNGNVRKVTITPGAGQVSFEQTYTYDALNRLQTASEVRNGQSQWQQTYGYDRYGNRVVSGDMPKGWLTPQDLNIDYDAATNRLRLPYWGHDAAGNQTSVYDEQLLQTFTSAYDGENRLVSANSGGGAAYSYDGEGRRVQKMVADVTTVFVYNAAGQLMAEYTDAAPAAGMGGTKYVTADTLGSTRLVTSGGKGDVKARYDYLPFGEGIGANVGARAALSEYGLAETLRQKFTGYERDSELGASGLDFAQARYFGNIQGRFTSVDPFEPVLELNQISLIQITSSPQSWNRYAYAYNNPLKYIDRNGRIGHIAAGIIAGAFFGAGAELVKQGIQHYLHGTPYDGRKILVAGAAGAVSGGIAALTGGLSVASSTVFGAINSPAARVGVMATAEIIEGGIERGFDGDSSTNVLDIASIGADVVSGVSGGAIGERFADGFMNSAIQSARIAVLQDQLARANRMANSAKGSTARAAGRQLVAETQAQIARTKAAVGAYAFISELVGKPIEEMLRGSVQAKPDNDGNTCGTKGRPPCVRLTLDGK